MPNNASEVTMAYRPEAAFMEGPADWDAGGDDIQVFLAIEPNWSGLRQQNVDNRQMRRRAYATLQKLQGLRMDGTFSFGVYASGSGATTAANSAAASFALADILQVGWKGLHLGYASAVVTPSATTPEITAGQGVNHPAGAPIFGMSAGGEGQFAIVSSVAVDVLTLRTTLDAAAAVVGAAIACYPHTRALTNRSHASHTTHSLFFRGEATEDVYEALGCTYNITSLENTDAGQDPSFTVEGLAADFNDVPLTRPDLDSTPQGPTGPIVGRAGTAVRIANVGTPGMTDVGAYTFQFTPGISHNRVPGVVEGGIQGYHGGGFDDTVLTVTVPYDNSWITDFRNGQRKHIMVQVGTARGDAWAIYLPNAEIAENPERGVSADETSMTLVFRAMEFPGTTHTEGSDEYELERAKFLVLLAA